MTTQDTIPAIQELKTRAEILHHRIEAQDPAALERLRALPQFNRKATEQFAAQPTATAPQIRRVDCLAIIATELGFANWPHLLQVISGSDPNPADFGTLLFPKHAAAHLNRWYRTYEEAVRDQAGSHSRAYLLAFRRQFVVVDRHYIPYALRVDPDDPDWEAIGFDWVRPKDVAARTRLYGKIIQLLPPEHADGRPLREHR
jgi:hypothetical protein